MFDRVGSLSDRLLSRVVPRTRASAQGCWRESISAGPVCRTCCYISSSVGVQCTQWVIC
jgi:hypothetical protein